MRLLNATNITSRVIFCGSVPAAAWEEAEEVGTDLLEQIALRRATVGEQRRVTRTRTKRDSKGRIIEEDEGP